MYRSLTTLTGNWRTELEFCRYQKRPALGGECNCRHACDYCRVVLTREPIRLTEQQNLHGDLSELLTPGSFNNDPALDTIYLSSPALGSVGPKVIYRARDNDTPTGAVITCIAPDGYNGDIGLLVGLSYNGNIVGVRVTHHNETPGLGDDIETRKSDWIYSFDNLIVGDIKPEEWNVKKEGGRFDQFTGATITPRAIVSSVYRVSLWYQQNREAVFRVVPANRQSSNKNIESIGNGSQSLGSMK